MMNQTSEQKKNGYGKRPLWQWIVIYIVIGGIIYAAAYYFFLRKSYGYPSGQYQLQSNQQVSPVSIPY